MVMDETLLNAQMRRLDGAPIAFRSQGEERAVKAKTEAGSWAGWPLGMNSAMHYPHILHVEGGPDLLAAAVAALLLSGRPLDDFGFICFTGANNDFPKDVFDKRIENCKVTIFGHRDGNRAGQKASSRWMSWYAEAGVKDLLAFRFVNGGAPNPVKDLNDLLRHREPSMIARLARALSR
jgi:hypothetical protein